MQTTDPHDGNQHAPRLVFLRHTSQLDPPFERVPACVGWINERNVIEGKDRWLTL